MFYSVLPVVGQREAAAYCSNKENPPHVVHKDLKKTCLMCVGLQFSINGMEINNCYFKISGKYFCQCGVFVVRRYQIIEQIRENMSSPVTQVDERSFLCAADGWGFLGTFRIIIGIGIGIGIRIRICVFSIHQYIWWKLHFYLEKEK